MKSFVTAQYISDLNYKENTSFGVNVVLDLVPQHIHTCVHTRTHTHTQIPSLGFLKLTNPYNGTNEISNNDSVLTLVR